jgi:hypothetical protein
MQNVNAMQKNQNLHRLDMMIFLNGSSVLPYITRSPPGLGTPLGQDTVFCGQSSITFDWNGPREKKSSPIVAGSLLNNWGALGSPPLPPPARPNEP